MNISAITPVRELVTSLRDELRERREARAAYEALRQELAVYTTAAEVDDLLGVMKDQDSPEAQQVREILLDNLSRTSHSHRAA